MVCNGMICNGLACNGMVCNGMVFNGMVCNGMVCNGMVWYVCILACEYIYIIIYIFTVHNNLIYITAIGECLALFVPVVISISIISIITLVAIGYLMDNLHWLLDG